jgi:hypothetical protein
VIVTSTLSLTGELATDLLLGAKARRLEELLAITATALTHRLGLPDQNCEPFILP